MATGLHDDARRFLDLIRRDIAQNASANEGFATALRRFDEEMAAGTFAARPVTPKPTEGCKWVAAGAEILKRTRPDLAAAIEAIREHLSWGARAAYPEELFAPGYFDDWAFTQVVGPGGLFSAGDFMMGMFAMGPGIFYPKHNHAAPELYYQLTGTHKWQVSDGPWVTRSAPAMIWHEAYEIHATEVLDEPFLSVWMWTQDIQEWPALA